MIAGVRTSCVIAAEQSSSSDNMRIVQESLFRTFKVEYVRMSESKKGSQKVREVIEDFFLQVIDGGQIDWSM